MHCKGIRPGKEKKAGKGDSECWDEGVEMLNCVVREKTLYLGTQLKDLLNTMRIPGQRILVQDNSKCKGLDRGTCLVDSQKATTELEMGEQGDRAMRRWNEKSVGIGQCSSGIIPRLAASASVGRVH